MTLLKQALIYNGVALSPSKLDITEKDSVNAFRREIGLEVGQGPLLGVVGQLTPWKGQLEALQAFALLVEQAPERWCKARLVIVGEAKFTSATARYDTRSYEQQLRRFVREHHLEQQIIFTGERHDIQNVMAGLDLLIVPSWHEPFGRVVIEAMAVGTAVLGTKAGGIPEIIEHGRSGWLVEPHNPAALAEAICTLFAAEPDVVAGLVAEAHQTVRDRFEISERVAELNEIYQAMIGNRTTSTAPIKLLFVNHTGQISGAEVSLLRTLQNLDSTHFWPYLACPLDSPLWQAVARLNRIQLRNVEAFTFTYRLRYNTFSSILRSCHQVYRLVEQERPAIIHANSIRSGLICGLVRLALRLRLRRPPRLVVHMRDDLNPGLINLLVRLTLVASSNLLLTVSSYVARRTRLWPWSEQRHYRTVHDGVDPLEFDPMGQSQATRQAVRAQFGLDHSHYPLIGLVGQVTPWKGHREAILAMPLILQQFPLARLLIIGTPKFVGRDTRYDTQRYYLELKQLATDLGLSEQVIFTGELSNMPRVMAALDIFLLCSWAEPFGLVYIEAMAMECPVVATQIGGPEEIVVQGQTGLKIPPRDSRAIAEAIITLASDPHHARLMGQRGRERVLKLFTAQRQARQLEQIYIELVK